MLDQLMMCRIISLMVVATALLMTDRLAAAGPATVQGHVNYSPAKDESSIPERFRLPAHTFVFEARALGLDSTSLEVWDVTFPSPVKTRSQANNTVHCEYYQPKE